MAVRQFKLLCVDDDLICLEQLRLALTPIKGDFDIRYAATPAEALGMHEKTPADIVISDLKMADTDGISLIAQMREIDDDAVYMLLSGQADLDAALSAVNDVHVFRFLIKPAETQTLEIALNAAITELNLRKLRMISFASHNAVERLTAGIAFLNENRHVIYANGSAKRILETSGLFEIGAERILRSTNPKTTYEFQDFLEKVRANSDAGDARSVFRFERADDPNFVFASASFHPPDGLNDAYYSLVLSNPARISASPEIIASALNILPSEARVVHALSNGGGLEEAARKTGISISSARTYLKNVFSKTGVSRQSELVQLVTLIAA
ncbi:DNA-binding response regulator [Hyphococcus luteus]|uniref:Response regulatory domain-containing protein n=1 Tax=Hyphococcus luteus TaxID=2058213 RepID=A0A2S7K0K9_9PROT|nr:response regulator [Marinicaulis flavus]PQA86055.1 hypothetical protein CW354_16910 [Marinicaulis flavus]